MARSQITPSRGDISADYGRPYNYQIAYLACDSGIYKTTDMGMSWARYGIPDLIYRDVAIDPANPQHIFAASTAAPSPVCVPNTRPASVPGMEPNEELSQALSEARQHRKTLHDAIVHLKKSISSPAAGRIPDWTASVLQGDDRGSRRVPAST